jgi:hypothetical protein
MKKILFLISILCMMVGFQAKSQTVVHYSQINESNLGDQFVLGGASADTLRESGVTPNKAYLCYITSPYNIDFAIQPHFYKASGTPSLTISLSQSLDGLNFTTVKNMTAHVLSGTSGDWLYHSQADTSCIVAPYLRVLFTPGAGAQKTKLSVTVKIYAKKSQL